MVTINWQQNLVSSYSVSYVMSDWQSLLWLHTESDFTTTIFDYLHETLNFLVCMLIKISISKFIKGGLIFMLINEFTCLIPQAPLKTWTFMLFTIFYNLIFCQILLRIWFTFRASTNNFRYWKKMKNGQSSRFDDSERLHHLQCLQPLHTTWR